MSKEAINMALPKKVHINTMTLKGDDSKIDYPAAIVELERRANTHDALVQHNAELTEALRDASVIYSQLHMSIDHATNICRGVDWKNHEETMRKINSALSKEQGQ